MPIIDIVLFGLGDSLNPCNLSTVVMFAAFLGWLRQHKVPVALNAWGLVFFSYVASLIYLTGGLMSVLYSVTFLIVMRFVYVLLGITFVLAGSLHLWDWINIYKGKRAAFILPLTDSEAPSKPFPVLLTRLAIIPLVFVLNAFATVWPNNKYIMIQAYSLYFPGQFTKTLIILMAYCVMLVLPMLLVPFWLSWTSKGGWVTRNITMVKVVLSAFYIGLGISLVCIFV